MVISETFVDVMATLYLITDSFRPILKRSEGQACDLPWFAIHVKSVVVRLKSLNSLASTASLLHSPRPQRSRILILLVIIGSLPLLRRPLNNWEPILLPLLDLESL